MKSRMRVSKYSTAEEAECNNTNKMNLTGAQSSAIYFNLHKNSKYRAALFRQLCATRPQIRPIVLKEKGR
jgi:DNA polymerase III psi subunit